MPDLANPTWHFCIRLQKALIRLIQTRSWPELLRDETIKNVLARRCVLRGVFHAQPQSYNPHVRSSHDEFSDGIFAKAAQLRKKHGPNSPCPACGKVFKRDHQCIAWTQIALLMLSLPPDTDEADSRQRLILHCEICCIRFTDTRQLLLHLRQRNIKVQDWLPSWGFKKWQTPTRTSQRQF